MYKGHRIIDGHVHYTLDIDPEYYISLLDATGTDMANIAVIRHGDRVSCTPEALVLKHMRPDRFYVSGSLDPSLYYRGGEDMGAGLAEHARRALACGCDGIKLLEGKPQLRRALPIPDFDAPCWEAFWSFAEEEQIPILWHVNDPECFWDASAVPVWAKAQGWLYDGSYVNNEAQYAQVQRVLERHGGLRVTLAHFYFMSARLPRLGELLARFPKLMTDLTPGIEMYENFSAAQEARRFFEDFGDRIIYGTDTGSRFVYNAPGRPFNERENLRRPELVRDFLFESGPLPVSADGDFIVGRPDFDMRCLGLSGDRLDAILSGNFLRFVGGGPRPVDVGRTLEECARLRAIPTLTAEGYPTLRPDVTGLTLAEKYFSGVEKLEEL